jgi:hypothetical protein
VSRLRPIKRRLIEWYTSSVAAIYEVQGTGVKATDLRVETNLLKQFSAFLPVQSPFAKIFRFAFTPNHNYIAPVPFLFEGRLAIVTDAGRDAVDAGSAKDERY